MFRLRIALALGMIVGALTGVFGLLEGLKLLTVAYRAVVSIILFGICGYVLGGYAETLFARQATDAQPKGRKIDVTSDDDINVDELLRQQDKEDFSPFTPDHFDHIHVKE